MMNGFKPNSVTLECPECGTSYVMFKGDACDIPILHRNCITCGCWFEVSNPFYIEEAEYVCIDSGDSDSRLPSCS